MWSRSEVLPSSVTGHAKPRPAPSPAYLALWNLSRIAEGARPVRCWQWWAFFDILYRGVPESRVMDAKTVLILAIGLAVLLLLGFCGTP